MSTKRTKLSPVYMTAAERDMVASALAELHSQLQGSSFSDADKWAKSYTRRRITEVRALFLDKEPTT